ncbi:hypothetical protein NEMBOFW57_006625 [Staphylotrichum longicolle]|uniref:Uncharacterized protein n=1 Tax=Staphylotrichum longicolle TaxID=669026 RepID=A0AAD4ETX9_9PEZI|nr:hypothetical protein NEMBOFW57_006625 [Staphylotrichum longicolle]
MARQFRLLAALALAHSASSTLLEPFVDVVVRVDVQVPADIFAGVLNAAGRSDDGYDACVAADSLLGDCVDAGAFATTAQIADANRCACCVGTTAISAVYSMCASYIANEEPGASSAFSMPPVTDVPPACNTMLGIYASCSRKLALGTSRVAARDAASCFCRDQSGTWNTAFEDYASSCAPFFKTNYPEDYDLVTALATFCDAYPPNTNTNPLVFTTAGTRSAGGFVVGSSSSSSSSKLSVTDATGPATSTATTSTSAGLAVPGAPVPGFLLWAANLVTFVLSFFILV